MGWTIVHEEQEDGVSGHKVRAENRDKLQIIKERAKQGKFDILLVFMFDRIGRIADETPFVVEWFVKNGIRVWSTQEGEQRFDNHTDKLTNYIRFWQADGESEKTSIRTKTALGQLVEDGGFKGGLAPYGYDLVKSGRFNKRKHEVYELAVNEAEAAVVRIIFDKYVHEGFGAQRIATYLNNLGYRARTGKMWHHASVRGIICNLTYTGVLRSGESRSQTLPHLQIIAPELFEAAQHIRTSRANSAEQERRVPLNTRGQSLLAGNVFCGHCGSRLALTTNGKAYPCKEDAHRIVKRVRYICYGKTRKQTECDGQTGYTAHILDGIIDKVVRQIFERMKAIPKSEIVNIRYREKMEERKALLKSAKSDYAKAAARILAPGGVFATVFPLDQIPRAEKAYREAGLLLMRRQDVIFKEGDPYGLGLFAGCRREDVPEGFAEAAGFPAQAPDITIRRRDGSVDPSIAMVRLCMGFPPGLAIPA
jgi:DNA invertase Pin-like site-specific DNA recombinase